MAKIKKDTEEKKKFEGATSNMLNSLLEGYKDDHFNYIESKEYKVSTGSLLLDSAISMGTGVHRMTGYSGSGKTSEALQILKNSLSTIKDCKGVYIKAEGRLSKSVKDRSGVKFVYSSEEWKTGTCFVFECNIFEAVADTLECLSKAAAGQNEVLCMIIDSMDALVLRNDAEKNVSENYKTAGPQALMKKFLARFALPLNKYGHICLILSQVSSAIKIDPYSKEMVRSTSSSGGFGLTHFADYILEFDYSYNSHKILENPGQKFDSEKNKAIGHWVHLTVCKSDKENSNTKVKYPVRYGQTDGNSIWVEYELVDVMIMYELAIKKGAWISFEESFRKEVAQAGFELPETVQGMDAARELLEKNKPLTKFLFDKFRMDLAVGHGSL